MGIANPDLAQPEMAGSRNASPGQVLRNLLSGYIASGVGIFTGLVVTPLLVRRLGNEQFGLWSLLSSVVAWLVLIELGISTTLVKRVAQYLAARDRNRLHEVIGTAQIIFFVVAFFVIVIGALIALFVGSLFRLSPGDVIIARMALFILTLNQAATFVGIVQTAVLIGMGRWDITTNIGIWISILIAAGNLIAVFSGAGVVGLAITTFAGTLLTLLCMTWILRIRYPDVSFSLRTASWHSAKELIRYGSRNAVVALAGSLSQGADTLIVAAFFPISAVGQYAIAAKLANFPRSIANKPVDVLMPTYSHSHALAEHDRLRRMFVQSITLSLALLLPALISLCVFGREIILLWVGSGHDGSYRIAVVLLLASTLQLPGHASFTILTATEKTWFLMKVCIVGSTCNFLLSVFLARLFGPIGVALGTLSVVVICDSILLPGWVCREFGFGLKPYYQEALGPLLLPSLCAAALALLLHQSSLLRQSLWPLVCIAATGCVFFAAMWTSGASRQYHVYIAQKALLLWKIRKPRGK